MSDFTINLTPAVYQYLQNHSLREPVVLKQLREETHKMPAARMQISPEQGQFMALLIEMLGAKKAIDIGTFTGYSALSVALAMSSDGKVIACDTSIKWTDIAKQFWERAGVENKIELHRRPALETLEFLLENNQAETFDFIFIDADKKNYVNYYEYGLKLLKKGGLLAVDNVLWSGRVADDSVQDEDTCAIRVFNEKVFHDNRVTMSLIPIGDGLTLARKK